MLKRFIRELEEDTKNINRKACFITSVGILALSLFVFILNLSQRKNLPLIIVHGAMVVYLSVLLVFYFFTKKFRILVIGIIGSLVALFTFYMIAGGSDGFQIIYIVLVPPLTLYLLKNAYQRGTQNERNDISREQRPCCSGIRGQCL